MNSNPQTPAPGTICIVRLSALGDVVMVLPLIKRLRRSWPHARITWIIGRAALPLVADLANEDIELIAIDKPRNPADYLALRRRFYDRTFDALLCLQASWRANLLYPCIRARRKIGYDPDRAKDMHSLFINEKLPPAPPHIVDGFFQFAEKLGATPDAGDHAAPWGITLAADAREWAAHTLPSARFLAVSSCSSKTERDWTPFAYAEVITHAWRTHALPSVLFTGPAERERAMAAQIRKNLAPEIPLTDLSGQTTIPQLAAALGRCTALLAPDTGAVHIARALGKPVIGLYAVAPAARTGPYLKTEYCIDKFAEALSTIAGIEPTHATWSQRVHDPRAMQLITPAEVCHQLNNALASATRPA